ncbi:ABC transporter permease [Microvirga brassicacearum]|uniref:ABC transporter permease n=1 Tax=Microvirga brassicacearum TaxID=2580413 RepID=A0A5N3P5L6_9HYPH|nr:ABC transporter permease [Microvirga brassicacearum]
MRAQTETIAGERQTRHLPRWMRHTGLTAGAVILVIIVLMGVFAPLLAPQDPYEQNLLARIVPPVWYEGGSWEHPLGTDHLGRDYLARLLYGARVSVFIGVTVAFVSGIIGTVLGVTAGYFGGKTDVVISFLITARLALPVILVALAIVALFGSSLTVVVSVLGLLLWDRFALVMRATTQQIRDADFVMAAKVQGASTLQIIVQEILPNVATNLTVVATLEIAQAIVLEAALSFLGLGVPPPLPSWGLMLAEGKSFILFDPWLITIPGVLLFGLVLAINLVGDGLRDVTAPDSRN